MKNKVALILTIILILAMMLSLAACRDFLSSADIREDEIKVYNAKVELCTGKGLTREQLAQKIADFEDVQNAYSGHTIDKTDNTMTEDYVFPDPRLETPGSHEVTDSTRYNIEPLGTDEYGALLGIKVTVINTPADETEKADTPEDKTQAQTQEFKVEKWESGKTVLNFVFSDNKVLYWPGKVWDDSYADHWESAAQPYTKEGNTITINTTLTWTKKYVASSNKERDKEINSAPFSDVIILRYLDENTMEFSNKVGDWEVTTLTRVQ